MKTLYIECAMGAAGDMLMASLYELLPDKAAFLQTMNGLGLPGVALQAVDAKTCGIAGTHMAVTVHGEEETEPAALDHTHAAEAPAEHLHSHDHPRDHHDHAHEHHDHSHDHAHGEDHPHTHQHATPGHIAEIIDALPLPEAVRAAARAVYDDIARAEAKAHGCPVGMSITMR